MIIPALDLIDGTVVRLHQGDYGKQRGWERATAGEPEFTEVQCELPMGLFDK